MDNLGSAGLRACCKRLFVKVIIFGLQNGVMSGLKYGKDVEKLVRADILNIEPYAPIIPLDILSERIKVPIEEIIKLDGNENPYGCSPKVQHALSSYPYYNIYPDPDQHELRKVLEGYVGVSASQIIAGSGSDELIDLILRLFIDPGDKVLNCPPTFGMYPFSTRICSGKVVSIPRNDSFEIDVESVKKNVDERTKAIFIASPNNPTGNTTSQQDIIEIVKMGLMVIVDEAYYEFSGETVIPLVARYDNLIVLRTFSKWAGIAGLRLGYGVFPTKIYKHLMKIKQPYNVNISAQIAAVETLKDLTYMQEIIETIIKERSRLFSKLAGLKNFNPLPSKANFILCHIKAMDAASIHHKLQQRGIFIRYFDTPLLKDYLRISVGKPEHTDTLISAIREIC